MKNIRLICLSIILCGLMAACQNTDKSGNDLADSSSLGKRADSASQVDSDEETKNETNQTKIDEDGTAFMKAAALGSGMEIDLGKVALQNSSDPKVKDFAAKMVADHTLAKSDLIKIAQKSGVLLPTEYPADIKAHMDEMSKLKGAAFDKHYIEMMVNDHDKTVTLFKTAASLRDDVLKDYAIKTLPTLQSHQTMAKEIHSVIK
ncbi:MAG: DUF4142 domain-containing protein [Bacteroidota bacterium]